jgi:Zn-dependent M16 (insulinase) family peptidase
MGSAIQLISELFDYGFLLVMIRTETGAQGAGVAFRARRCRASASCENPNWLSCLRRVKRLFTGEVFTQNSNLSCTSA